MPKVLSQSGISLADAYDIQGSVAGVEELDSESVKTVHEMGSTMFSERLSGIIKRVAIGPILQSTAFVALIDNFESNAITRILGVSAIADLDRIDFIQCSLATPGAALEFPFWAWDTAVDQSVNIRWDDNGAGSTNDFQLRPTGAGGMNLPTMLFGTDQLRVVPNIRIRGQSTAFGAGNVNVVVEILEAFADLQGVSSHGLPVPGW